MRTLCQNANFLRVPLKFDVVSSGQGSQNASGLTPPGLKGSNGNLTVVVAASGLSFSKEEQQ